LHDFKSNPLLASAPLEQDNQPTPQLKFLDEMSEEDLGNLEEYIESKDTDLQLFGYMISTKVITNNKPVVLYFDWDGEDSCVVEFNQNRVRLGKYIYCDYMGTWENKQTGHRERDINIIITIGKDSFEFTIDSWDVLRFSDYIFQLKDDNPLKVRVMIDFTLNMKYNLIKIGLIEID
jgi:hypothetical protein